MKIIDVHAHVFPDEIAKKATESVCAFYGLQNCHAGTLDGLLKAHEAAGISRACIHSVAVTPQSIASINRFIAASAQAHPDRLAGFAAIHPDAPDFSALLNEAGAAGLKGFKIHPDMQKFALDEPKAMEMFAALEGRFPVIIHTGDSRFAYSHPGQMKKVLEAFPDLTCICAHLGGWSEWGDACRMLAPFENAYVDTSSSLYALDPEEAVRIIRCYSRERVLFGTDYPMWEPAEEVRRFLSLCLTDGERENILYRNAEALLQF